jgi:hypothetical protein
MKVCVLRANPCVHFCFSDSSPMVFVSQRRHFLLFLSIFCHLPISISNLWLVVLNLHKIMALLIPTHFTLHHVKSHYNLILYYTSTYVEQVGVSQLSIRPIWQNGKTHIIIWLWNMGTWEHRDNWKGSYTLYNFVNYFYS